MKLLLVVISIYVKQDTHRDTPCISCIVHHTAPICIFYSHATCPSLANVVEISLQFNINIREAHTNESLNELEQYNNRRTWHEHLYNTDNIHFGIIGLEITTMPMILMGNDMAGAFENVLISPLWLNMALWVGHNREF